MVRGSKETHLLASVGEERRPGAAATPTSYQGVRCRDLTVRYGSFTAVDAVSLDAAPGEIVGLLGPNGAGKTSVIRALTTIVRPAAGSAEVAGHPVSSAQAVRSLIGVLPESNGYPGAQTARSYLGFYGQLFGQARGEALDRADGLLDRMGLAGIERPIGTFSRGMRQRLGLARALVNDPQVLFLDEPTLGLDPGGQEDILAELTRSAVEDGTCVVVSSHLLDEVERVCDRVAVMDRGRVVAAGTVAEVVTASGVAGFGTVRVAPEEVATAEAALRSVPTVSGVEFDNARPGDIRVRLEQDDLGARRVLAALLDAAVAPRAFDLHGARLSDAFLALTSRRGR